MYSLSSINRLKKLQYDESISESTLQLEKHRIECKYQEELEQLYEQCSEIINGLGYSAFKGIGLAPEAIRAEFGIQKFWLTVLKNTLYFKKRIKPCEEEILKYLTDVEFENIEHIMGTWKPAGDRRQIKRIGPKIILNGPSVSLDEKKYLGGLALKFYFGENPYFRNELLQKVYYYKFLPDKKNPWIFGKEILHIQGCTINWTHPLNNFCYYCNKQHTDPLKCPTEKHGCFFDFFKTPYIPPEGEIVNEDPKDILEDFDFAFHLKNNVIPNAAHYFTGEILELNKELISKK